VPVGRDASASIEVLQGLNLSELVTRTNVWNEASVSLSKGCSVTLVSAWIAQFSDWMTPIRSPAGKDCFLPYQGLEVEGMKRPGRVADGR
jgi:hypothetical protein